MSSEKPGLSWISLSYRGLAIAVMVALLGGCSGRSSEASSRSNASVDAAQPTSAVVLGKWAWRNDRGLLIDHWIPEKWKAGTQEQAATFTADGRMTLWVSTVKPGEEPFQGPWSGSWIVDPFRESSIEVTLDPIPEEPGPKVGIKGKMMVRFKLERVGQEWVLIRPIEDGYLSFLRAN